MELDFRLPLAGGALQVKASLQGPSVAVLGRSGAGKTSLLEAVAGLRKGLEGRVVLQGRVLEDSAAKERLPPEARRVGYVPQDALLFPHLTAGENVRFGVGPLRGDAARADEAVELLELSPLLGRLPHTLSGGERQRVALARALATAPALLLLDEPLAALDAGLKERILPFLVRVREELRVPLLYVTHQHAEARLLADEVLVLEAGAVAAVGPAAAVLAHTPFATDRPENILVGTLEAGEGGVTRLRLTPGCVLAVPPARLPAGSRTAYAVSPDDVLVASAVPTELSARNLLPARVARVEPSEPDLLVALEADGGPWLARLTPSAVAELGLVPGRAVWLAIKAHALRPLR